MQKTVVIICFMFIFGYYIPSFAFYPPTTQPMQGSARVDVGLNDRNNLNTSPRINAINRVIINTDSPNVIVTPPPPPPGRRTFRYKDFAGPKRYPSRSYYIPSYCMPGVGFHSDVYNPFCNHYRPYGSNLYISF